MGLCLCTACTRAGACVVPLRLELRLSRDAAGHVAEDRGFEPLRAVNPTRFPSERHRPLGESSAGSVPVTAEGVEIAPEPTQPRAKFAGDVPLA